MSAPLPTAAHMSSRRWRSQLKRLRAGRLLESGWRTSRALRRAAQAAAAERADLKRGRVPPPAPPRRDVTSVVLFISGPGRLEELLDSIDSVIASDGDRSQIIVVDDCSIDARETIVRERHPEVDVIRSRRPSLGPPNITPLTLLGIERALERYRFEQCIKMDSDALITGPGLSAAVAARFAAAPGAGLAGAHLMRCDGAPYANTWFHAETIAWEAERDPLLAAAVARARARGWVPGEIVEGGVFALSGAACAALERDGWLQWRPRAHCLVSEDLAFSTIVRACGLDFLEIGGPQDGLFAVDTRSLPLSKEEVAAGTWVAAHSVKAGCEDESEATLRAFFRRLRADWRQPGWFNLEQAEAQMTARGVYRAPKRGRLFPL